MSNSRRPVVIPAVNAFEEVRFVEEMPTTATGIGWVRVSVATVDSNGVMVHPQMKQYLIKEQDYIKLNGPPSSGTPGKPNGTYRNEDLWTFIDQQRAKGAH